MSGAVASAATGFILDHTGHFFWAFALAAGFCVIGVLSWLLVVSRVEPVVWMPQRSVALTAVATEMPKVHVLLDLEQKRLAVEE